MNSKFFKLYRINEYITIISLIIILYLHFQNIQIENLIKTLDNESKNYKILFMLSELNKNKSLEEKYIDKQHKTYTSKISENLMPNDINNTKYGLETHAFFNRVPKVGSQTIIQLLKSLANINNFRVKNDPANPYEIVRMNLKLQKIYVNKILNQPPPTVFIKHTAFTNFSYHNKPQPIYFNQVRNPIERVISWYYYSRSPWRIIIRQNKRPKTPLPDVEWLKKDFNSCVLKNDNECHFHDGDIDHVGDHRRQTLFFCGHGDECLPFNGEIPLKIAKHNVETYYAVVGVLEDMNVTLTVLEHYIPKYFKGATKVFWNQIEDSRENNKNIYKPPVFDKVKNLLKPNFTREMEFYEFCRQRLYKQYYALKNKNKI